MGVVAETKSGLVVVGVNSPSCIIFALSVLAQDSSASGGEEGTRKLDA